MPANSSCSNSFDPLINLINNSGNIEEDSAQLQKQTLNESDHLRIDYKIVRESQAKIRLTIFYSNLGCDPITNVTLQLASPKSTTLLLQPQSGNYLQSNVKNGIQQIVSIEGMPLTSGKAIKLKWKANYSIKGVSKEESGTTTLPI